ncbi:class F sortase [Planomonospora sphaerica]|uniref:class F sortase n=1 Tax=Planomonospora sphaerica TaxID=161355 RepID=UPI00083B5AB7|nr:class F sortase [Planomonospora sphaerica]
MLWIESVPPPPVASAAAAARPWNPFTWFLVIVGVLAAVATPLALTGRILTAADNASVADPDPRTALALEQEPPAGPASATPSTSATGPDAGPSSESATAAGLPRSAPVRIRIPAIGVSAPVMAVGLEADGVVGAPPVEQPNLAGWYRYGPTPGQIGPAVILGHVDTTSGPAVFARLRELAPGDEIEITRRDGRLVTFVVDGLEKAPKRNFPTGRVYGRLDHAGLRLITCGGAFDRSARSYIDNVIVYAHAR